MLRRGSDQRKASRKPRPAERPRPHARGGKGRNDPGPRKDSRRISPSDSFVLYVEGARDREILEYWARRVAPEVARVIDRQAVILGGRQPARAVVDFRKRGGALAGLRGLIVLDRDDHPENATDPAVLAEDGLEIFSWSHRHIESYLLVPAVLRRLVGLDPDDRRIERFVETGEQGPESLHAKRVLGAGGSLSAALGVELRAGEIARAMRPDELHQDVLDLFERIARAAGLIRLGPEVVMRTREDR